MELVNQINELERCFSKAEVLNTSVSSRGIDWHIDHCLKVINVSLNVLLKSKPKDYKWKFNLYKAIFLPIGTFPRNRVKAPKVVNNRAEILFKDLELQLAEAKSYLDKIDRLPPKSNFRHPFFGLLTKKETLRFLEVHTNHHLKIIKAILEN